MCSVGSLEPDCHGAYSIDRIASTPELVESNFIFRLKTPRIIDSTRSSKKPSKGPKETIRTFGRAVAQSVITIQ